MDCFRFVARRFHVRKLPKMGVHHPGRPLTDQQFPLTPHYKRREKAGRDRDPLAQIRQFLHPLLPAGDTLFSHGADQTLSVARGANERAQFHERLVEVGTVFTRRVSSLSAIGKWGRGSG